MTIPRVATLLDRLRFWRQPEAGGEHSFRRYRGIILGGGFAGLSKLISLAAVAVSVPLTVGYLGPERYGMWMTISSLVAVLSFADLGIGNGLVTALANSDGRSDSRRLAGLVTSAVYLLVGVGISILTSFLIMYPFVSWERVFGVSSARAVAESGPSVLTFIVCFAVGLPLSLVQRVQAGLQEGWRANLWQTAGSLASLASVVIAARKQAGVVWLLLAMSGGPILLNAINTAVEFWVRRPALRPSPSNYDSAILRSLLRSGAVFVTLQVCVLFGSASDSVVIAQMFGASAVGPYAVLYKLFQTSLIFGLFTYPLWPALGEALARGDYAWAHRALARAIVVVSAAGVVLALVFLLGAREIVHLWVGDRIAPDWLLVSGFAAWILPSAFGGTITSLFNNSQFLRVQLKTYGAASIVALALKVPLAWWLGPAGVVWASALAYSFVYCLPAGLIAKRFFQAKIELSGTPAVRSREIR